jgi:putative ABC transport system permease protein
MGQVPNFQKPEFLTAEGRYRNPIREVLPPGAIEIGYDLARSAGISPGDTVTLFGEEFTVHRVHSRTGNDDDVTVWCNLEKVQGWFDLAGKINGILALECVCDFEEFGRVEQEVRGILPDTQVLEFGTILRARFDARARAAAMRESAIDSEIAYRAQLGGQRQRLVRFLIPVVVVGALVWIFFLILSNVKERRGEIAVMRTVGVGQRTIMGVFLGKAALMGAAGSVIGCLLGLIGVAAWEGIPVWTGDFGLVLRPGMAALTLVGTLVLAVVAGWIPALKAARLDPATILREE